MSPKWLGINPQLLAESQNNWEHWERQGSSAEMSCVDSPAL